MTESKQESTAPLSAGLLPGETERSINAKWRKQMASAPIKSCGRLDMSTSLPDEETLGRVTSDRVRYVYFEDGSECIVLGKFCDFVAFQAADHARLLSAYESVLRERDELRPIYRDLRQLCGDMEDQSVMVPAVEKPWRALLGILDRWDTEAHQCD